VNLPSVCYSFPEAPDSVIALRSRLDPGCRAARRSSTATPDKANSPANISPVGPLPAINFVPSDRHNPTPSGRISLKLHAALVFLLDHSPRVLRPRANSKPLAAVFWVCILLGFCVLDFPWEEVLS
jgi:hypothetical protein